MNVAMRNTFKKLNKLKKLPVELINWQNAKKCKQAEYDKNWFYPQNC